MTALSEAASDAILSNIDLTGLPLDVKMSIIEVCPCHRVFTATPPEHEREVFLWLNQGEENPERGWEIRQRFAAGEFSVGGEP